MEIPEQRFIIRVTNVAIILPGDMKYKPTLQIKAKDYKHVKDGGQHFRRACGKVFTSEQ